METNSAVAQQAPQFPGHPHKSTTHREKFYHFTGLDHPEFQAVTVFAREEQPGTWYMTTACCIHDDRFERRIGRQVARRRYFDDWNTSKCKRVGPECTYEIVKQMVVEFLNKSRW